MDAFEDRLTRLGDLTDNEVTALEGELVAAFDAADGEGDVDSMSRIADSLDTVRAERKRRANAPATEAPAPAAEAQPTDAPQPVAASGADVLDPPAEVLDTDAATPDTPEVPAAEAAPEGDTPEEVAPEVATDEVAAPEAVADEALASDPTTPQEETPNMADEIDLTAADAPIEAQPEVTDFTPPTVIRAGGDIPGHNAGEELTSLDEVADAMTARINSFARLTGGDGEQVIVASLSVTNEDEDRTLRRGDASGNSDKIRKALAPEAITAAANGWCAPRAPIYDIFGLGDTGRPVRDSLPSFNAERGGVTWSTPPKLADAGFGVGFWGWAASNGGEWQAAGDPGSGTPTDNTKVLFKATCPAELTADLEAITTQLQFTNMMARAYPELVKRNMELALIAHDRFAESRLLYHMWALCDTTVTANPSIPLGATRDFLFTLRTLAASYRNRHRMAPGSTVDAWAPAWLRDAMAADVADQAPGDGTLDTSLGEVTGYIASLNVNVTWYWDDVPGNGTSQYFADASSSFPANAAVILAAPGTFLHLDGGTLDLGVVRDSTLVGTNEYIEFTESFENVAKVGIEAQKITVPVFVQGGTAAGVTTTAGVILS